MVYTSIKTAHVLNSLHKFRLQTQFEENSEGSVELSVVQEMVTKKYPGLRISAITLSRTMREIFPHASVKRVGKKRVSCIAGIEMRSSPSLASAPAASSSPHSTMTTFPCTSPQTDSQIATLMLELQLERDRRAALEVEVEKLKKVQEDKHGGEVQSAVDYQQILQSEVDTTICSQQMLLHGPDTVKRFEEFSMSGIIAELQSSCPELFTLVQQLGSTQRNARPDTLPVEHLKGVTAVCTLLNAQSARVKGLQLMISLMLVARATGKQVYIQ